MADRKHAASRRDILKLGAGSVPAVVALVAASATGAGASEPETPRGGGMQKTEHVKKYLETARF